MQETNPVPLPELFQRLADLADQSAAVLKSWGVKVPQNSRLDQASALLRERASKASLEPSAESVAPVLRAVWVAADFTDIAAYLPKDGIGSMRQELSAAIKGDLAPIAGDRHAVQLQSQHWIGAILSRIGLDLEHAESNSTNPVKIPEFFIVNGAKRIGVEVKRPESDQNMPAVVAKAMKKFRDHDCFGAIVLELTDCVDVSSEARLLASASTLMADAHGAVWDLEQNRYQPGFESLIYLGGVVRGGWEVASSEAVRLRMKGHAFHQGYSGRPNTLQDRRSQWLQPKFNEAFAAVVDRLNRMQFGPTGA